MFAVAAYLTRAEIQPRLVAMVLGHLREHSGLLNPEKRDVYLKIYPPLISLTEEKQALFVIHLTAKRAAEHIQDEIIKRVPLSMFMHLGAIWRMLDERIAMFPYERAEREQIMLDKKRRRSKFPRIT